MTVALLGIAAVVGPLAFGATEVWAYCGLQVLVAVAAVLWAFSGPKQWSLLWLPLAVVVLGTIQTISLPRPLIEHVSSLSDNAQTTAQTLTSRRAIRCVSVNTSNTQAALRRCLMLALIVMITADVAQIARFRRWLLTCVASVGATILFLGLIVGEGFDNKALGFHDLRGVYKQYKNPLLSGFHSSGFGYADEVFVGRIHYVSNSPVGGAAMGAMINANHFAACIGLTLPVIIGVLCSWEAGSSWARWLRRFFVVDYVAAAAFAVAVPAHSRGGISAICLSGLLVACLAASRTRKRVVLLLSWSALLAAGCVITVFQTGLDQYLGSRGTACKAAYEMFVRSPWLGVGLGNFGCTCPAFVPGDVVLYLAHNAWVESAAESGVLGLAVLGAAVGWAGWCVVSTWDANVSPAQRTLRLGLCGGVLFAALHGVVDHGIQIPANACLCAMLIGTLLGDVLSTRPLRQAALSASSPRWTSPLGKLLVFSLAGFLAYGALRETYADWLMMPLRRAIARQRLPEKTLSQKQKFGELLAALPNGERAFEINPRNADFAEYLGQAQLHFSQGRDGPQLQVAGVWFSRSLQLCPVNPWIRRTLVEIRSPARSQESAPRADPR